MTQTSALPEAIQWYEGMLLSPQHFQQNDLYWQAQLRHRLQRINPHYWGVLHLRYQLNKEVIRFSELDCILPDGLPVQFPGTFARQQAGDLSLDIGEACKEGGKPLRVWLLVNDRGAMAACADSIERRYNSVIAPPSADENTGSGWLALSRLQVQMSLTIGNVSPSSQGAVPLLEVVRGDNGQLQITPYHPPLLHLAASSFQREDSLWQQLNDLHDLLWRKAGALAAQSGETGQRPSTGRENTPFTAARQLACCLPQLSILMDEQNPPAMLYQALAQVVGQVSSLSPNALPLLMKPYQHEDCMPQFQAAIDYIQLCLASVDSVYETLQFSRAAQHEHSTQNLCFERRLLADMRDKLFIELKPTAGQSRAQLFSWLSEAVIADEILMPQLLRQRMTGAAVRALTETEIAHNKMPADSVLFLVENRMLTINDGGPVAAFQPEQVLLIYGRNNASTPKAIILHHKRPATQVGERHE